MKRYDEEIFGSTAEELEKAKKRARLGTADDEHAAYSYNVVESDPEIEPTEIRMDDEADLDIIDESTADAAKTSYAKYAGFASFNDPSQYFAEHAASPRGQNEHSPASIYAKANDYQKKQFLLRADRPVSDTPPHDPFANPTAVSASLQRKSRWDAKQPESIALTTEQPKRKSRWGAPSDVASNASSNTLSDLAEAVQQHPPTQLTPAVAVAVAQEQPFALGNMQILERALQKKSHEDLTPDEVTILKLEKTLKERNFAWSVERLHALLPDTGYKILDPPKDYVPIHTARRLGPSILSSETAKPIIASESEIHEQDQDETGFRIQTEQRSSESYGILLEKHLSDYVDGAESVPIKPEDDKLFSQILKPATNAADQKEISEEEQKEQQILQLLLKAKNGNPPIRKVAIKQLVKNCQRLGAPLIFKHLLRILGSLHLTELERHFLVKVTDRIMLKLDFLVRPFVRQILDVIQPMLIDPDYYARLEGRQVLSNLTKAAGLAAMISAMRDELAHEEEYNRNLASRTFAIVASSLGIPSLLPFLKAICRSKKSWESRHTGFKTVQQIAILNGCAILPHLKSLVDLITPGLQDENSKTKSQCALAFASLAEASTPYGIDNFDPALPALRAGVDTYTGKLLASFLKAIGYIIPLMDASHAVWFTKAILHPLRREMVSPDMEMKKVVLKVVKQIISTDGIKADFIEKELLRPFFLHFWGTQIKNSSDPTDPSNPLSFYEKDEALHLQSSLASTKRLAIDTRIAKQLVDTTIELGNQLTTTTPLLRALVPELRDESEVYKNMVLETLEALISNGGVDNIDQALEASLMDSLLISFQEQTDFSSFVPLNTFATVLNALKYRARDYMTQIIGNLLWRMNNKNAQIRKQAADLIQRIASVLKICDEDQVLKLVPILYDYLGEEYPDVLASIINALKALCLAVGFHRLETPSVGDILPRIKPILKNRHEQVSENLIDFMGRIAEKAPEYVNSREWMRVVFDLLELLKAPRLSIRRSTVSTFGHIAKSIGPQDVVVTLLNNLKVQDRTIRVCTTVAIAIVAETCGPFTVIPYLMHEYKTPELNVQNGVLKSLSFLFEYIADSAKDYAYALAELLEDALTDRDLVHRQLACNIIKHMGLHCMGYGLEDLFTHLLNYVWPNIFERSSLHLKMAFFECIEALTVALGPGIMLNYILQGLFHPARFIREIYWRIYNSVLMLHHDAMVAYYPTVSSEYVVYPKRSPIRAYPVDTEPQDLSAFIQPGDDIDDEQQPMFQGFHSYEIHELFYVL